ncbi:Dipeptidyl aminopeptidase/acylaminoacyl-peptidase [Staphylococcus gallinarum]|uniref:Dipeptidyl aminopeptidase/acylaminoacyl-peptidase n=1 Tax=Staphylococcus gallinarum TaxID=1293 RepID=A0A380FI92_STAGA|nr:Dipeptidyl aminopeptidase/acylaminoacyl-peptidase [Staphylococcus gallinarum]
MAFINHKRMPVESLDHIFEEVTYLVDNLKVRGLMMRPTRTVKRIVIYLRGGKGQVGDGPYRTFDAIF